MDEDEALDVPELESQIETIEFMASQLQMKEGGPEIQGWRHHYGLLVCYRLL